MNASLEQTKAAFFLGMGAELAGMPKIMAHLVECPECFSVCNALCQKVYSTGEYHTDFVDQAIKLIKSHIYPKKEP